MSDPVTYCACRCGKYERDHHCRHPNPDRLPVLIRPDAPAKHLRTQIELKRDPAAVYERLSERSAHPLRAPVNQLHDTAEQVANGNRSEQIWRSEPPRSLGKAGKDAKDVEGDKQHGDDGPSDGEVERATLIDTLSQQASKEEDREAYHHDVDKLVVVSVIFVHRPSDQIANHHQYRAAHDVRVFMSSTKDEGMEIWIHQVAHQDATHVPRPPDPELTKHPEPEHRQVHAEDQRGLLRNEIVIREEPDANDQVRQIQANQTAIHEVTERRPFRHGKVQGHARQEQEDIDADVANAEGLIKPSERWGDHKPLTENAMIEHHPKDGYSVQLRSILADKVKAKAHFRPFLPNPAAPRTRTHHLVDCGASTR